MGIPRFAFVGYVYSTPFEKEILIDKKYQRTRNDNHIFMFQDDENNHYRGTPRSYGILSKKERSAK